MPKTSGMLASTLEMTSFVKPISWSLSDVMCGQPVSFIEPMMCSIMPLIFGLEYPSLLRAAGTPLLIILREPPPASVLYCMRENCGSTPVVSAPMTSPIVPVGAITVVCAFLYPCSSPSLSALSQAPRAASRRSFGHFLALIPMGGTERPSYSSAGTS